MHAVSYNSEMRITRIEPTALRLPAARSISLPVHGAPAQRLADRCAVVVHVHTDSGLTGLGFGAFDSGIRSIVAAIETDLAPLLVSTDPLRHEKPLAASRALDNSVIQPAYALIDIALWDLKAKAANTPLWRLLGGARDRVPVHCADTAAPHRSAEEVIAQGRAAISQGMKGIRVALAGVDPEADAQKAQAIRDALGEEIWFGITVHRPYDYETALPMGRFIEEEIGADWFENPLADHDVESYSRLSLRIDTPLAAGSRFTDAGQFVRLLETGARVILRPDVLRLGGITPWLKVAAYAEVLHRPIVPHLLPEIGVHLACGLPGVQAVDSTAALGPVFNSSVVIVDGYAKPPEATGHGFEVTKDTIDRFRI